MPIFDRQSRQNLDHLVEEYVTTNNVNRRQFLKRATAAGLSVSAASALLAACGSTTTTTTSGGSNVPKVTSIDALTEWSGEELDSFNAINAAFTAKYKIKVNVESTRDLPTILTTRLKANNPPDICGMPTMATFTQLAQQKKLVALDSYFDMSTYQQNYAKAWQDLSSYNGHLYAILPKANSKGTIWYNPTTFQAIGGTIPQTWNDLISLSDKIAGQGKFPWAMGVESAASSGWPAADWIDQIFLGLNGPDAYENWIAHKIPWTDKTVKDTFQMFGQIVNGKHYINGAPQSILATNFQDATFLPYTNPPQAYLYYLGDFAAGFITAQYTSIQAGTGFNFFPFPTLNSQYKDSVTGSADMMVALKDNDGTRQFTEFLSSAEAQQIWVKRGGATSANKAVDLSLYPNDVARASAKQLTGAGFFKVGADDQMPQVVENAFWKATLTYIQDPTQLDSALSTLESTAQTAYTS
jgi:alpha-glucoside transport system substrate-binding protein